MSGQIGSPDENGRVRKVGRPRAFQDTDVYAAISSVLIRDGFHELTLGAVANELDVSTPALARRFGDKHEMLQAYLENTDRYVERICAEFALRYSSPIDSLRARWKLPTSLGPSEAESKDRVLAWVEFLLAVRTDPWYGAILERRTRVWIEGVAERLEAAHNAGEIIETDVSFLAHVLSSAMTGAMLFWFEHRRGDLYEEITRVFEFMLAPYRGAAYPAPAAMREPAIALGC